MIDLWLKEKTTLSIKQSYFLLTSQNVAQTLLLKEKKVTKEKSHKGGAHKHFIVTDYFKLISLYKWIKPIKQNRNTNK